MALVNQFGYIIQGLNSTARLSIKKWSCRFFGGPELFFRGIQRLECYCSTATYMILHINIVLSMPMTGNDSVNNIYSISYTVFGSDTVLF